MDAAMNATGDERKPVRIEHIQATTVKDLPSDFLFPRVHLLQDSAYHSLASQVILTLAPPLQGEPLLSALW